METVLNLCRLFLLICLFWFSSTVIPRGSQILVCVNRTCDQLCGLNVVFKIRVCIYTFRGNIILLHVELLVSGKFQECGKRLLQGVNISGFTGGKALSENTFAGIS